MTEREREKTIALKAAEVSNAAYLTVAPLYEGMERDGLITGNGHRMALDLARASVAILREHVTLTSDPRETTSEKCGDDDCEKCYPPPPLTVWDFTGCAARAAVLFTLTWLLFHRWEAIGLVIMLDTLRSFTKAARRGKED